MRLQIADLRMMHLQVT